MQNLLVLETLIELCTTTALALGYILRTESLNLFCPLSPTTKMAGFPSLVLFILCPPLPRFHQAFFHPLPLGFFFFFLLSLRLRLSFLFHPRVTRVRYGLHIFSPTFIFQCLPHPAGGMHEKKINQHI